MPAALRVDNVSQRLDGLAALDGASIAALPGQTNGIAGWSVF